MRILVTGASGNIGTALLRELRAEHEVIGIARRPPQLDGVYASATWHSVDLAAPDAVARLAELATGVDAVVHLAWEFQPSHRLDQLERTGVGGSAAVVNAVERAGVPHLVHMSSVGAYAPAGGERVTETWPTTGIRSLAYSRHKVAVERELDALERRIAARGDDVVVTRFRPGFVVQRDAGSGLARYGLPAYLPAQLLRLLPLLPLDQRLQAPIVHSEDVADAIVRALLRRAEGPFNLATEPPLTTDVAAQVLGARAVHVPASTLRPVTSLLWHARLQPVDPGWLDLAYSVPLLDTTRARDVLDWTPLWSTEQAVKDVVAGILQGDGTASPVLRPRSVPAELRRLFDRGSVSERRTP
jgi:nucleoside-diphosphate-sugar epimerase